MVGKLWHYFWNCPKLLKYFLVVTCSFTSCYSKSAHFSQSSMCKSGIKIGIVNYWRPLEYSLYDFNGLLDTGDRSMDEDEEFRASLMVWCYFDVVVLLWNWSSSKEVNIHKIRSMLSNVPEIRLNAEWWLSFCKHIYLLTQNAQCSIGFLRGGSRNWNVIENEISLYMRSQILITWSLQSGTNLLLHPNANYSLSNYQIMCVINTVMCIQSRTFNVIHA